MNIKQIIGGFVFALFFSSSVAQAAIVPFDFTHHGILWDGNKLASGRTDIEAVLYDDSGASPVKIKSVRTYVNVDNGYYAITIPNIDPAQILAANGHLSFQLIIADQPLEPKIPISSVPYALVAHRANSARVADAATDVLCEGCVNYDNMSEDIQKILNNADSDGKINAISAGVVGNNEISFNYAGSNSKGGAASAIADDIVSTAKISNSAVTNAKLADDVHYALSDKKGGAASSIADGTVSTGKIVNGNVTKEKLATSVQTSLNKADNALPNTTRYALSGSIGGSASSIADGTVTTIKIVDKNVTLAKLSDAVQTSLAKADAAITTGNNTVSTNMIQDNAITSAKVNFNYAGSNSEGGAATSIADGTVTKAKLSGIYAALAKGKINIVFNNSCQGSQSGVSCTCKPSSITKSGLSSGTNATLDTSSGSLTITHNSITNPVVISNMAYSNSTTTQVIYSDLSYANGNNTSSTCVSKTLDFVIFGD